MKTKEITIPTSWSEIELKTFRAYTMYKGQNKEVSALEEKMFCVELFCNLTAEEVRSLNIQDLNNVYGELIKILEDKNAQIKFEQTFKFKGKEYGFVPNLSKLSTGEWVDYEELMKQGGYWENAHKIMSILFRPITKSRGKKYSIEDYNDEHINKHSEDFLSLTMDRVIGAQSFFFRLGIDLLETLRTYTLAEKEKRSIKKGLEKSKLITP